MYRHICRSVYPRGEALSTCLRVLSGRVQPAGVRGPVAQSGEVAAGPRAARVGLRRPQLGHPQ